MVNSNNHIVMLHREQLHPHPDNPRKDLGDLEELRASIAERGIMQNLTVVPVPCEPDQYVILIGHRRFAASEGILEDLPCVIAEGLTNKEQVGIMLCENMQRSDLTVFEQAHGFQLMLDLGESVETISEKTGFSQSTIKHRLEINKLNKKSIETAQEKFQPTISDYIKLEKVKDIKERNRILSEALNSQELEDDIDSYIEEITREGNEKKYRELFESLGLKESKEYFNFWSSDSKYKKIKDLEEVDLSKDFDADKVKTALSKVTAPVLYRVGYRSIEFAIKSPQKENKTKTKEELLAEKRKSREAALNDVRIQICDLYYKHIVEIPEQRIKEISDKEYKDFISKLCEILFKISASMKSPDKYYNIKTKCDTKSIETDFPKYDLLQQLMLVVWEHLSSTYENKLVQWNFTKNVTALEAHQELFGILYFFGFRLNDDQKAIINGKSDLYEVKL